MELQRRGQVGDGGREDHRTVLDSVNIRHSLLEITFSRFSIKLHIKKKIKSPPKQLNFKFELLFQTAHLTPCGVCERRRS